MLLRLKKCRNPCPDPLPTKCDYVEMLKSGDPTKYNALLTDLLSAVTAFKKAEQDALRGAPTTNPRMTLHEAMFLHEQGETSSHEIHELWMKAGEALSRFTKALRAVVLDGGGRAIPLIFKLLDSECE